jgi:hypothetical protein
MNREVICENLLQKEAFMKRILVVLIMVVFSFPMASVGGESVGAGKTGGTGDDNRKQAGRGTLSIGSYAKTHDVDDRSGKEKDDDSTAKSDLTPTSSAGQPSGVNSLGFGKAVIDGIMSPDEWDNAVRTDFVANIPGGGTTPATLYVMNDGLNLYMALKIARPSFGYMTQLAVDFDNNNKGVPVQGDDGFQIYAGSTTPPMYIDTYLCACPGSAGSADCMIQDESPNGCILPPGTSDGAGAATNDGTYTVMEVSHLLNSKDTLHDFILRPGSRVGYHVTLTLTEMGTSSIQPVIPPSIGPSGPAAGPSGGPSVVPPPNPPVTAVTQVPLASTGTYYGQLNIISNIVTRNIDITPGRNVHSINSKSEGKIPVAILSTQDFNAPAQVDRHSLTFGHAGSEDSLAFCNEGAEDVNGDGLPDLICHFKTQAAGFTLDDRFGRLNGKTRDGSAFTATDSVRIVR